MVPNMWRVMSPVPMHAHRVDTDDAGMADDGERHRLAIQRLRIEVRKDHFDGDAPLQPSVIRSVNAAHAPFAEQRSYFVTVDDVARLDPAWNVETDN